MEPKFWLNRWQENRIGFHQPEINAFLKSYWSRLALPANSCVFVPLCGKTFDMEWLASQGHRVVGVELSEIAVRDFFAGQNLQPDIAVQGEFIRYRAGGVTLLCGDFFALTTEDLQGATAAFDRAALIALPADLRIAYAAHLKRLLPSAAQLLLISMEYEEAAMQGPPFSVTQAEVSTLFAADCELELLHEAVADARGTPCIERMQLLRYR